MHIFIVGYQWQWLSNCQALQWNMPHLIYLCKILNIKEWAILNLREMWLTHLVGVEAFTLLEFLFIHWVDTRHWLCANTQWFIGLIHLNVQMLKTNSKKKLNHGFKAPVLFFIDFLSITEVLFAYYLNILCICDRWIFTRIWLQKLLRKMNLSQLVNTAIFSCKKNKIIKWLEYFNEMSEVDNNQSEKQKWGKLWFLTTQSLLQ